MNDVRLCHRCGAQYLVGAPHLPICLGCWNLQFWEQRGPEQAPVPPIGNTREDTRSWRSGSQDVWAVGMPLLIFGILGILVSQPLKTLLLLGTGAFCWAAVAAGWGRKRR